ncbi:aldehyde dehydrogenase family protein [Dolosicoccus paucivorans]|uniref:Aldehyde dehydrogenase n=1 Tax=Dolosicoccus paucivorans TaxID=84521 RepID=A0A1G8KLK2_9LACT|nr:aldehyde dehydrogenase family protein [Dolosicoccus paucivorans]PMC58176.1 aldehyde dehydrogenase [Dolosicoccus paucivorans]SDI44295.1 Acyl-CoA reductase [Dolosicoccus paucivorans]
MSRPDVNLLDEYGLFINGEFKPASDGQTRTSYSPADGKALADFAEATKEDVDEAVKVAQEAYVDFKKWTKQERAQLLLKIADVIDANADHFALVETMDNGKPIRETSAIDVPQAADHFRYFAGVIEAEEGTVNKISNDVMSIVIREPMGVVGQIIPWNFPFLMAAWKIAPALAAGNTIVIKPSSTTSLSILELARLTKDIIPKGVLNVITGGGGRSGEYILDHPGFVKLAFTGSTEVGRRVAEKAAERLIPSTLELGGKSANIIFDDADLDLAVDGALLGILFNQGQVCSAGSRIFVQENIYDTFIERLSTAFKKVKVGLPWDPETQMGAVIDKGQCNKVLEYVDIAKEEGAVIHTGGVKVGGDLEDGYFIEPTLVTQVDNSMRTAQEEIFGPMAVVIKFKDEDDVVKMANDSDYGLAGGVFTKDGSCALRVANALETGRVWINTYANLPAGAPFGGYKQSGIGRETHKLALDAYSQVKNIMIDSSGQPSGLYDLK